MNARQEQERFVKLVRYHKFPLGSKIWLSVKLSHQVASLSDFLHLHDNEAFLYVCAKTFAWFFIWADKHDTYVSYDSADKYVAECMESTDGVTTIGLLHQNLARIYTLYAGEEAAGVQLSEDWECSAPRLFNNFALNAKLGGLDYSDVIKVAYASLRNLG